MLLDAFRRGEPTALAEVFREYVRPLSKVIRTGISFECDGRKQWVNGCVDRSVAEDVSQETFRRAFEPKNRDRYDGIRPYLSYLVRIARNFMVDLRRTERREPLRTGSRELGGTDEDFSAPASCEDASPEAMLQRAELSRAVQSFVDQLEPTEREIYQLRFLERFSIAEVARRLRVSEHSIKAAEGKLKQRFYWQMRKFDLVDGHDHAGGRGSLWAKTKRALFRDGPGSSLPRPKK